MIIGDIHIIYISPQPAATNQERDKIRQRRIAHQNSMTNYMIIGDIYILLPSLPRPFKGNIITIPQRKNILIRIF